MKTRIITALGTTIGLAALLASHSALAAPLALGDDTFEQVSLDFTFNFQGIDYNDIWVGSNGFLTFGSGDTDFTETTGEFLSDEPRIAGFWDDLAPNNGGSVDATGDLDSMLVSWDMVPEFVSTGSNTFSIELFDTGTIQIAFGEMTAADGIVGISPGNGLAADPGEEDFSAGSGLYGNTGVIYEQFAGDFDLSGMTLTFEASPRAVPEPGTLALLGLGLVSMGFARRKKS